MKCHHCKDKRIILITYGGGGKKFVPVSCDRCEGVSDDYIEDMKRRLKGRRSEQLEFEGVRR